MVQDTVPGLSLGFGDDFVRLRQFLQIVDAGFKRIDVNLRGPDPQHVQDNLCILWIVLVPAVMQRLSSSGQCN